jgi:hypothetical protein
MRCSASKKQGMGGRDMELRDYVLRGSRPSSARSDISSSSRINQKESPGKRLLTYTGPHSHLKRG